MTGVAAKYENNRIKLRAGAIFWTDGSSNSQQDLKRRWFFAEDPAQTLEVLLRKWQEEGARSLMRHGRETAGLRIFESKKSYLAHLRKVFDVSENAFNLLNRAAGLKQLDSVDTIFRELVLDDRSGFDRALEVASDFDTLAGIHQELEEARKQRESLLPIATDSTKLEKTEARLLEWRQVKELAPHREDDLRARFLELGGRDLEQIEATIMAKEELLRAKPEESAWRGAIERALGSNRLRILVPMEEMREALRWVNARDNRLHVRLQEARLDEAERDHFHDSFLHKLTLKRHRLRPALENLLARQDYHCVADPEALREVPHGLTKEVFVEEQGPPFSEEEKLAAKRFNKSDEVTAGGLEQALRATISRIEDEI